MKRLLLMKAHVADHQRHLASGAVVPVKAHDDSRPSAVATEAVSGDIIPPGWTTNKRDKTEYSRPIPPGNAFHGGQRKTVKVWHFKDDNTASLQHPSGYVSKHPSLDAAFEHAEKTIYAKPDD